MEPGSFIVRIKLRYDTIDIFVEKYAINVGRTAVFLPTKSTREVGSEVRFELRIADDKPALVGIGKVLAVRPFDAKRPTATFGMVVELTRISKDSRSVVQRMLDIRKQRGLDDMALPIPHSAAAAQRPVVESTGVETVPVPLPLPLRDSEPILTVAARPPGASMGQAIRSLAATNEQFFADADQDILRTNVDVPSALALARKLAASGAGLDADLLALQQSVSVPLTIDIDEASAELAQVLGGVAVQHRQRSAGWAGPPRVTAAVPSAATPAGLPLVSRLARGKGPTSPPPPAREQANAVAPAAVVPARATTPIAETAAPDNGAGVVPTPIPPIERPDIVLDTEFESPPAASLSDDFSPIPQAGPADIAPSVARFTPEEPTHIGPPVPRTQTAKTILISDDMDLNALDEHTDFSALGPQAPAIVAVANAASLDEESLDADAMEIEVDAMEIEVEAATEWSQRAPTVMGQLDANLLAGAAREPVVTPPPPAGAEFDFSAIGETLRRRSSTPPPTQNRPVAHSQAGSGPARTNRHITSRHTSQPANRIPATPPAWGEEDAGGFEAAPPVTVFAPDISARLSAIELDADDNDFSLNDPLTHAERPVIPSFQLAASPPASTSLDDALLSMSTEDDEHDDEHDDDSGFFFEPPRHLPNELSNDRASITSATPSSQAEDDIPIEMDFEVLAEFEDDETQGR